MPEGRSDPSLFSSRVLPAVRAFLRPHLRFSILLVATCVHESGRYISYASDLWGW